MTPLKFHPAVYQDIADAYNWYQLQLDGLGDDFIKKPEKLYMSCLLSINFVIFYICQH